MLELKLVNKVVRRDSHISNVSLLLERSSLNVLLGPTLSGKTTLMRLMAGLDKPTSGDILINGKSVLDVPVRKRNVAMVYQQFINYPGLTVYENIASPMRLAGNTKSDIDRRVREAASLLRLEPYLDRTPLNLSGGQQQRTAIARALVKDAELVLLDEPLANLDYKLREELRLELPKIFAESGAVFVYATTEPQEALLLGGNTATLSEGRVTQFNSTIEIYNKPADLVTARTFADPPLNTMNVIKRGRELQIKSNGRIKSVSLNDRASELPDDKYILAVRAHHVLLSPDNQSKLSFNAIVSGSEITGSETFIHVQSGEHRWVVLAPGVCRVANGDNIDLFIDPDRLYLFDKQQKLAHEPAKIAAGA